MMHDPIESHRAHLPPLDTTQPSIRLLKARTGSRPDQLSYDVLTFTLAQCPPYKALSYTWGSPFPPDQVSNPLGQRFPSDEVFEERAFDWSIETIIIQCNGHTVQIGQNLFEALSQLSVVGEQGFIWIDRLCIDQRNLSERSSQVAMMSEIYSRAVTVIVWLGRGGEDSLAALQIQNNFAGPIFDLVTEGKLSDKDLQDHNPDDDSYLPTFNLKETYLDVWFAWTQFFRRSWFYRRWTLQETALAKPLDVLCGDQRLDWYKIQFLVRYFRISGWQSYLKRYMATEFQPTRAFLAREFMESIFSNPEQWKSECIASYGSFSAGTVFMEVLYRSCMLQCSDPRDMIYGMLGIVEKAPQPQDFRPITVDYSTNTVELYRVVAKVSIESIPDLPILSLVQDPNRRSIQGLPSWIPDFFGMAGYVMDRRLGLNRRRPDTPQYNVAFHSQSTPPERVVQGSTLHLKGYRIGNLIECGIDFRSEKPDMTAENALSSMLDICRGLPPILKDGQDRIQALWRTIVADSESYSRPAPPELGNCFHDWILKLLFFFRTSRKTWPERLSTVCEGLTKLSEGTPTLFPLADVSASSIWWNRLQDASSENAFGEITKYMSLASVHRFDSAAVLANRVLFRTTEGDVGYGPVSSKPGDQVWVLENARIPFILRPTMTASSFEVVGECYVHGIMDGQLFANGSLDYVSLSLV